MTRKLFLVFACCPILFAQFRGGSDWSAHGSDAQRTSWIKSDAKISPASLAGNGFQLLYKLKLGDEPLSTPVLLDRYIGYRGFRSYVFVGGANEDAFALDSDLGRLEWRQHISAATGKGSGTCPGGMTAALTRPVTANFPSNAQPRFGGGGRGGPAKSGVGEPMEGAVTLAQVAANRPPTPPVPPPATPAAADGAARVGTVNNNPFAPRATLLFALSGDGAVHAMYVSNGEEAAPKIPFLPAGANVIDFVVVDGIAYATTANQCGGAADGLWAVDLTSKTPASWQGSITGDAAFTPIGAFVTSGTKLISLNASTLAAGAFYDAGQAFSTSPLAFEYKTKPMIAAATKDGVVHLIDASALTAAAAKSEAGEGEPFALATWESTAGNRWLIESSAKSITAWKVKDETNGLSLAKGWTIADAKSPTAPLIINGVLFVLDRGDNGHHAKLLAYDAASGKQLWTSGNAITSFVSKSGGLAAGGASVYFGTHDGTLWAFGFPIEH